MKKLFIAITVLVVFASCKSKGWSSAERTDFISICTNKMAQKIGADTAKAYCTCMEQKLEVKYANSQDASKAMNAPGGMDTPEMNAMVDACLSGGGNVNTNPLGNPVGNINVNPNNQGDGWSNEQKQNFANDFAKRISDKYDPATAQKIANCFADKVAQKYPNYNDLTRTGTEEESKQKEAEGAEMSKECVTEITQGGGNINGNTRNSWSDEDKQKVMDECVNHVAISFDNETKNRFCDCFVGKMMQKYSNYDELDRLTTKTEGMQITRDCVAELHIDEDDTRNGNNTGGNWTTEQHQQFVQACATAAQQKQGMTAQEANAYCDCITTKIAHQYSFDEANHLTPAQIHSPEWQQAMIDCGARH